VEAEVELAVAGAGEPVAENVAGGRVDRCGYRCRWRTRAGGAESVGGADPAEDLATVTTNNQYQRQYFRK